ncbi:hypothetical protein GF420_06320 [candidate division GN15 bacterium]|nr:hypothetical protein [candidate division GN15 bacterium]
MDPYFTILSLVLLVGGIICALVALRYRTEQAPSFTNLQALNPRHWRLVWQNDDHYSTRGFHLQLIGVIMIVAGGLVSAIFVW